MSELATDEPAVTREFTLSPELAAAVAAVSGGAVPGTGPLDPGEPPLEQLRGAGLLEPDRDELRVGLATALRIVASPTCGLTLATGIPDEQSWERLVLYGGMDAEDGFAAVSTQTGSTVVMSVPSAAHAAATMVGPLKLDRAPAPEGDTLRLGIAGWAALLAIADVHHERGLKTTLARDTKPVQESFNDRDLAQAATRGANGGDLRWWSTLGLAMTPVPLPKDRTVLAQGIEELAAAGMAALDGKTYTLTARGRRLELLMRTVMVVGALAVIWEEVGDHPSVALVPIDAAGFTAVVQQLAHFARTAQPREDETALIGASPSIESADVPVIGQTNVCPSCGAAMSHGERFCTACGTSTDVPVTCPNCKAQLRPGAAFCPSCGNNLAE